MHRQLQATLDHPHDGVNSVESSGHGLGSLSLNGSPRDSDDGGGGGGTGGVGGDIFITSKVHDVAVHCNGMKEACKAAQFQSDKVFLKAYLRQHPPIVADAIVVGVGSSSLQLYIPTLAFNERLLVSKLGYRGTMDNAFMPVGVADTSGGGADDRNSPVVAQLQLYTAQGHHSGGDNQDKSKNGRENKKPTTTPASRMITHSLDKSNKLPPQTSATPPSTPPLFTLSFLSVVKVKVSCDTRPKPSEIHIELI